MQSGSFEMSLEAGRAAKEAGLDRAQTAAGASWMTIALDALTFVASVNDEFAVEDVRRWMADKGLPMPKSHKAWGSLPRVAVAAGLIEWTGFYMPARSTLTHAHPVRIYRKAL